MGVGLCAVGETFELRRNYFKNLLIVDLFKLLCKNLLSAEVPITLLNARKNLKFFAYRRVY